jgi:hypothetical protein
MLIVALAVLAFQQTSVSIQISGSKGASVKVRSTDGRDSSVENVRRRIVATPEQLENAFVDASARVLLAQAREARLGQDSSILAYDASTVQRFTLGMGLSKFGRDRIFFRHEGAARVRWARGVGARIDVTGKRSAVPMLGGSSEVDIESILSPVPYYPGRDALWFGFQQARANATDEDIVHPLATSAEAYYTYKTGDSITFRLPAGDTIRLRELEVRPRQANWRAVVGSLWFDTRTGQLVRAAYRMSQPFDLLADGDENDPVARALMRPATATISGVAVEYGLYQGRFWLPRSQVGEGILKASIMRMPLRIEEHFTYASVNAADTAVVVPPPRARADMVARSSGNSDSAIVAARKAECDEVGTYSTRVTRQGGALPVIVRVLCDTVALARSPALPRTIFDSGEEVFGDAERDALLEKAKSMMPDLPRGPRRPHVEWGVDMLRYNRVEGLSSALEVSRSFLLGYSVLLRPRFGIADRIPNGELSFSRTTGAGTASITGYRRLAVANDDWGNPLNFGSGLSAFLFGRDEGFYYRTAGAEIESDHLLGTSWQWRVFHEQQGDAAPQTSLSLAKTLGSSGFDPATNIAALRIRETGASLRNVKSFGLDPRAFRVMSDLRIEGATGDLDYGRAALDLTLSHPIGRLLNRAFSASITASAGSSVGTLPVQRMWYLGGTSSIRGQPAGVAVGNSYWLTRTEVGYGPAGFRRIAFFDLGWAGDRKSWTEDVGRPASGVGIGWSFLDGLLRADIARGLFPRKDWRGALYLEAKF